MNTNSSYRRYLLVCCVISGALMSACAQSRQDLIKQAQLTGDWTAVDKRIEAVARYEEENRQFCPRGTRLFCVKRIRDEQCSCVSDWQGRDMLKRLGF